MEGQKGTSWKRTSPGTGEQYLMALFKCAEWIPAAYKQLAAAEENKRNTEALKELYLCACDGVPVEKAAEGIQKQPPEGVLRLVRQRHLESTMFADYRTELSELKQTASVLEQELREVSGTLAHIEGYVPGFDAMFPEISEAGQEQQPVTGEVQLTAAGEAVLPRKPVKTDKKESAVHKLVSFIDRKKGILFLRKGEGRKEQQTGKITPFMEAWIKEGYSDEQLDYFLDCIEAGKQPSDIERIASPKLSVAMMRRLFILEERKGKQNGE